LSALDWDGKNAGMSPLWA